MSRSRQTYRAKFRTEVDEVIYSFSLPAKKLVAMVASSACENVLNKRVGTLGFTRPFAPSELWFHAHFQLNVAGLLPSSCMNYPQMSR